MARNRYIQIRLSDDEYHAINKRVGELDKSTWLRQLALGQPIAEQPKRQPKKVIHTADPELIRAVNRIGININQIAKQLNAGTELSNAILIALLNLQTSLDETVQRVIKDDS